MKRRQFLKISAGLVGVAVADFDGDGRIGPVVYNYVQFSYDDLKKCKYAAIRAYCEQRAYVGLPFSLYHNNGNEHSWT